MKGNPKGNGRTVPHRETTEEQMVAAMDEFREVLSSGKDAAFVVRKGRLRQSHGVLHQFQNDPLKNRRGAAAGNPEGEIL